MAISLDYLTKIISVTTPQVKLTVQEFVNAVRDSEDELLNMSFMKVIDAVGKADLGEGVFTGIVVSLNPLWQIQFWQNSGVTKVDGGTIVGGVGDVPIKASGAAGDITILQNPVNSTIISSSGGTALTAQETRNAMSLPSSGGQDSLDDKLNSLSGSSDYIIQVLKNKRALVKSGSIWSLIVYADDNITPILEKELKDVNGNDLTDIQVGALAIELKTTV